jgi:hypothetical protein
LEKVRQQAICPAVRMGTSDWACIGPRFAFLKTTMTAIPTVSPFDLAAGRHSAPGADRGRAAARVIRVRNELSLSM